ncbi:hypothetical protein [Dietzia maris]|uniref:hypothetical protein n=1 Tax=Dietzia maris TaxID=37915 RepID=UPI0037CCBA6F
MEDRNKMMAGRRRAVAFSVVVTVVVALVVAAGLYLRDPMQEAALRGLDETHIGTVGANGFDQTYEYSALGRSESIRVAVPFGAAPEGTEVRVRVVYDRAKLGIGELGGLLVGTGLTADINLDGGAVQPTAPVIVEIFDPTEELGGDPVLASTLEGGRYEPLRTTSWSDGNRVIHRAEMDHLTPVMFFGVDLGGLVGGVRRAWDSMMGRSERPDCVGKTVTVGGRDYSAGTALRVEGERFTGEMSDAVWPCLEVGPDGNMVVTLQNNNPVGWAVHSEPRPVNAWAAGTAIDDLVSGVAAHAMTDLTRTQGFILPNMTTHLSYDRPARFIGLEQDPLPGLLMSLAFGIDQSLTALRGAPTNAGRMAPDSGVRAQVRQLMDRAASNDEIAAVMTNRDIGDCFLALLDHIGQSDDLSSFVNGVVKCFQVTLGGGVLDKLAGMALGTISGGLQLVVGQLTGAWNAVSGDQRVGVVITGGERDDGVSSTSEVPAGELGNDTPMDVGMQILMRTWQRHGAALQLAPDWTGRLKMNSGAFTGGEWIVRWDGVSATEVTVRVGQQLTAYPQSLGSNGPVPGSTYSARMSSDGTRLTMNRLSGDGFDSVEFCSSEAMGQDCGA